MAKYAALVSSASEGAITRAPHDPNDPNHPNPENPR
jgi:hypothetical protein